MGHIFLILFLVFSIIHLIFCFRDDRVGRKRTKPLLIITLLVYYLLSAQGPSLLLAVALVMSWIGDILLIKPGEKWLIAGGVSFITTHILLVLFFRRQAELSGQPVVLMIVLFVLYIAVAYAVIRRIREKTSGVMQLLLWLYLLINAVMNMFAAMRMTTLGTPGSVLVYAGSVFFFLSDCALFLLLYLDDPKIVFKRNFTIMITYLAAEFLIVTGVLMG